MVPAALVVVGRDAEVACVEQNALVAVLEELGDGIGGAELGDVALVVGVADEGVGTGDGAFGVAAVVGGDTDGPFVVVSGVEVHFWPAFYRP